MPRPATVTTLLRIVEEQAKAIVSLTAALSGARNCHETRNTGTQHAFVTNTDLSAMTVAHKGLPLGSQLPDDVQRAIDRVPGLDSDMRVYLEAWAAEALDGGTDAVQVVQMIAQGEQ